MKTSVVVLTLILGLALPLKPGLAKPKPLFFDFGVGPSVITSSLPGFGLGPITISGRTEDANRGSDGISKDSVNLQKQRFDGFMNNLNTNNQIARNGMNFMEVIRNAGGNVIRQNVDVLLQQMLPNIRAIVDSFLSNLNERVVNVRNRFKRQALAATKRHLEELNDYVDDLQHQIKQLRKKATSDVEQQDQDILRSWNMWARHVLEHVDKSGDGNEEVIAEAEQLVDDLVNRYEDYLNDCADEVEVELDEHESKVQDAVERYQPMLQGLIEDVQGCLESSDRNSDGRRCSRGIMGQLSGLHGVHAELDQLVDAGVRLLDERYEQRLCVVATVSDFEKEKHDVEERIEKLLQEVNDDSSNESSDESSDESSAESSDESSDESSSGSSDESSNESSNESSDESSDESSGESSDVSSDKSDETVTEDVQTEINGSSTEKVDSDNTSEVTVNSDEGVDTTTINAVDDSVDDESSTTDVSDSDDSVTDSYT